MVFAKARFIIFTESAVQHPGEAVFNLPMGLDALQELLGGSLPATDEVAGRDFRLGADDAHGHQFHQAA